MRRDAKDEDDRLLIQLEKRVLNNEIAEATAMLQVFAVKNLAIALDRRRNDERVVHES